MSENNFKIQLFEDKKMRMEWDEDNEKWWLSVVDVVSILTDNDYQTARKYWKNLKSRILKEGADFQLVTNCYQLKMQSTDGKFYNTDVGDAEQILRLVQSIPSKKAEPFKMWLAKVGNERMDEIADPELAIERALETYLKKGYSNNWINQRLKTIEVRKEWADEVFARGITEKKDFAILTNEMTEAWSGKSIKAYKKYKGLHKENLRDNMTNVELILNMLAEVTATDLTKEKNPQTMEQHKTVARRGGGVAKAARLQYEEEMGKEAVSPLNGLNLKHLKDKNDENSDD